MFFKVFFLKSALLNIQSTSNKSFFYERLYFSIWSTFFYFLLNGGSYPLSQHHLLRPFAHIIACLFLTFSSTLKALLEISQLLGI